MSIRDDRLRSSCGQSPKKLSTQSGAIAMPKPILPHANAVLIEKEGHTTYHLVPKDQWEAQAATPSYLPEGFEDEGFIHCTDTIDEVIAVGNRHYQGDTRSFLLLAIECGSVAAPIVYEDSGQVFPHIYGPLEVGAVRRVHRVTRDREGRFLSVDAT